jgi:hypothetical protein
LRIDLKLYGSQAQTNKVLFYGVVVEFVLVLIMISVLYVGNVVYFLQVINMALGLVTTQHRVYRLLPLRIKVKMSTWRMMAPLILVAFGVLLYVGFKYNILVV